MPAKTPTFHAVFIGINAYTNCRQLNGCINDIRAMSQFFRRLCEQQSLEEAGSIAWQPHFYLLPHDDEKQVLEAEGIQYQEPSRENLIRAFDHFKHADPEAGDYCLLYYSGHGSYINAPEIFSEVEPAGTLQTLVCSDSRSPGGRDLVDKELGYLIAEALDGKAPSDTQPGVHFLALFDSCHSGSVSRSDAPLTARMESRGNDLPDEQSLLGFTRSGNVFYKKFEPGQEKVAYDGLKHARYINLSASRDSEVAQEKILDSYIETEPGSKKSHGVFSYSLIRTLERSGTDLSYRELIRRVEMEVRSRVDRQIPVLGRSTVGDEDLFFLRRNFKAPKKTFEVHHRETFDGWEWYLNGGAINGISAGMDGQKALVQLTDGSKRLVEVLRVKGMESILDAGAFTEADREKNLEAILHTMPFQKILIGSGPKLADADWKQLAGLFAQKEYQYIADAGDQDTPQYVVNPILDRSGNKAFMLNRPGSSVPLFMRNANLANLLHDTNQVGKWENTLKLANPDTQIPRADLKVKCRVLEGLDYAEGLVHDQSGNYRNRLLEQFGEVQENPDGLQLNYKKVGGKFVAPALYVEIENLAAHQNYWVGSLYLDSQFGINQKNLKVQELSRSGQAAAHLEFEQGNIKVPFLPIFMDPYNHEYGISEIQDYLILVVAKKSFSLDNYQQDPLPMDTKRSQGLFLTATKEDDWFTIKIPLRISYPMEAVRLQGGEAKKLSRTYREFQYNVPTRSQTLTIEAPEGFSAKLTAATRSRAKRVAEKAQSGRSAANIQGILPPARLFNGTEGAEGVFTKSMAASPDQHLSILELTEVSGAVDPEHQLVIDPGDPLELDETIIPFGYDEENDLYFPLGYTDGNGKVVIEDLPKPTAEVISSDAEEDPLDQDGKSLGRSIKLFFNKIVWSRLSGIHDYRSLALIQELAPGNYEKTVFHGTASSDDQAVAVKIQAQIQDQDQGKKGVLLLIHGIIGNTDAQVSAVFEKTRIADHFGAVLTYDYENLNTGIEETAKHLLKSLQTIGIQEKQLTIIAHSMGGLVSRQMIEQEGGAALVKDLIQVGTPNGGSEISDFRKKVTGWLTLGINGLAFVQPYLPILSFIGKAAEKQVFKTLNQMGPKSEFLGSLNAGSPPVGVNYHLLAGNTTFIQAPIEQQDSVWKKIVKAIRKRGLYLAVDYLLYSKKPNDLAVTVESMKKLPVDPDMREVDCDHLNYFGHPQSLDILQEWTQ